MAIFDFFGKKPASAMSSFEMECELHPYRLSAHKNDSVELEVYLKNISTIEQLTSLVIILPKTFGMDKTGLSQQKELRLGMLLPGEKKRVLLQLWGTQRTDPGNYSIKIYAIANYRDYGHVLNETRKIVELRVV